MKEKLNKFLDIQVWVLSRSTSGRSVNVLGTSRINLPGTSLERQIKTSPGRHLRTSPGRQIGTSLERSNRIFRGRPGDVGGGRPRDVLGPVFVAWDSVSFLLLLLIINQHVFLYNIVYIYSLDIFLYFHGQKH